MSPCPSSPVRPRADSQAEQMGMVPCQSVPSRPLALSEPLALSSDGRCPVAFGVPGDDVPSPCLKCGDVDFDRSTTADSDDAESLDFEPESMDSEPGSSAFDPASPRIPMGDRKDAVIMFDWDDTLCQTSSIRSAEPQSVDDMAKHAQLIEKVLRAACAVARVAIVTLSQRPWVTYSAERHLPGLDMPNLLEELDIVVYYSMEEAEKCPGALENHDWVALKKSSMAQCLKDISEEDGFGDAGPLTVVSIGDSESERWALIDLLCDEDEENTAARPWCKTLKLAEKPTLEALRGELQQLLPLLPDMVKVEKDFDVSL